MKRLRIVHKRIIPILALATVLIFGSVLAVYFQSTQVNNQFTTSSSAIEVNEKFNESDKWLPGEEKVKQVAFTNTGKTPMLMRFVLEVKLYNAEGEEVSMENLEEFYSLKWNKNFYSTWTSRANGDQNHLGYYYFNHVLQPGENTGITLESVKFSKNLTNDGHNDENYSNYTLSVKVKAESIQVSKDAVLEEWREDVTDLTVGSDQNVTWELK